MRATAAADPTTARRLSGASPGNRPEGGRRRSLRRRHEKPKTGEFCFGAFGEFYFGIDTPPRKGASEASRQAGRL